MLGLIGELVIVDVAIVEGRFLITSITHSRILETITRQKSETEIIDTALREGTPVTLAVS